MVEKFRARKIFPQVFREWNDMYSKCSAMGESRRRKGGEGNKVIPASCPPPNAAQTKRGKNAVQTSRKE
jgi:hypothetical protein